MPASRQTREPATRCEVCRSLCWTYGVPTKQVPRKRSNDPGAPLGPGEIRLSASIAPPRGTLSDPLAPLSLKSPADVLRTLSPFLIFTSLRPQPACECAGALGGTPDPGLPEWLSDFAQLLNLSPSSSLRSRQKYFPPWLSCCEIKSNPGIMGHLAERLGIVSTQQRAAHLGWDSACRWLSAALSLTT